MYHTINIKCKCNVRWETEKSRTREKTWEHHQHVPSPSLHVSNKFSYFKILCRLASQSFSWQSLEYAITGNLLETLVSCLHLYSPSRLEAGNDRTTTAMYFEFFHECLWTCPDFYFHPFTSLHFRIKRNVHILFTPVQWGIEFGRLTENLM